MLLPANDQCAPIAIWAKSVTDAIGIEEIGYNELTTPIELEYYLQLNSENRNYTKLLELLNELNKAISSDFLKDHQNTDDLLAMHYRVNYLLHNIHPSLENAFLPFAVEYFTVEESDSDNDNFEEPYKFKFPDLLKQVDRGDCAAHMELALAESAQPVQAGIINELTDQVSNKFLQAAKNILIWQKKAIDYDMPFEKNEPNLRHKLKNYLIKISKRFPTPLVNAIGLGKFFEYPKLRTMSSTETTPEMMQGNEIMWGIIPPQEGNGGEYPFVSLCLTSKFFDKPCTVTVTFGIHGDEEAWHISGAYKNLPCHQVHGYANALTWDFIGRLSRHEPCGLPKFDQHYFESEGSRTLPDGSSFLELTDQETATRPTY